MKLSREQRDRIRAGGAPRLVYPGEKPCPLEVGDVLRVASSLSIRIDRIRRSKKGEWVAVYTILDDRVQLMRRVPPIYEAPEVDDRGFPIPHDKEAIEKARVEGAITSSPTLAVPGDAGEVVPFEYETVIYMNARKNWAAHRAAEKAEALAREDAKRISATVRDTLVSMARTGIDPTPYLADLERVVLPSEDENAA